MAGWGRATWGTGPWGQPAGITVDVTGQSKSIVATDLSLFVSL